MSHPATKPNGECDTPTCECHALAHRTLADDYRQYVEAVRSIEPKDDVVSERGDYPLKETATNCFVPVDPHPLEIGPSELIGLLEAVAYKAGARAERARVRAAIFDVLDAGVPCENHTDCGTRYAWRFQRDESDTETERRVRFVDRVCERLEELG